MNILVTGGTGFIGGHLVRALVSRRHRVFCLTRDRGKADALRAGGVMPVIGELCQEDLARIVPRGIDAVCHCAGILGKWGVPASVYEKTHIAGTKNLLRVCAAQKIRRFIHCSSVGVLGPSGTRPLNEDAPYNPTTVYEFTKAEAEKAVGELANAGELDATIIRPAVVYGPADRHMLGMFAAIQRNIFPLMGQGRAMFQPVFVEDVARIFARCLEADSTIGRVYILAGEKPVTIREFAETVARIAGARLPRRTISVRGARFMALLCEAAGKVSGMQPPLTRSAVKFFTEDKVYSIARAVSELGYRPVGLEEGLRRTIGWYRENRWLK